MSATPAILLSFDLEEFDIPLEYASDLSLDEQLDVSTRGAAALLDLLDRCAVRCTFFITAQYARCRPAVVERIAATHEVASHSLFHSQFENAHLAESRRILQDISGQPVTGFRRARLAATDNQAIADAGYRYDSSINPTYLPGRYNNLDKPRRLYALTPELVELPISTMPFTRFPIFWLSLKNLPTAVTGVMSRLALKRDGYLNTFAHPWEFADLSKYAMLPGYVRRVDGDRWLNKLATLIAGWKSAGRFMAISDYLSEYDAPEHEA